MRFGCYRYCCCRRYCTFRYRPHLRWPLLLGSILLLLVVLVVFSENSSYWGGTIGNWYGNYYTHLLYFPITRRREFLLEAANDSTDSSRQLKIGVVVVVNQSKDVGEYQLAQQTLQCYCQFHKYSFFFIVLETDSINNRTHGDVSSWKKNCTQNDFMFRRHCVLAQLLRRYQALDYVLFVDADIGVINPNHLLEDYIQVPTADLVFYDRLFNYEVMAGSYIARRSNYTIQLLEGWADYFYRLPNSFHGSDNGAIHAVLLDHLCMQCAPTKKKICHELWAKSVDYTGLSLYTSCARSILGYRNLFMDDEHVDGRIVILSNSTGYWARDGWLTGNQWSADDFMLHGWQSRKLDRVVFAGWHSPLGEHSTIDSWCGQETQARAHLKWPYKDTFVKSKEYIRKSLVNSAAYGYAQHLKNLRQIDYKFMNDMLGNGLFS